MGYKNYQQGVASTYIRSLYSPGLSYFLLTYFKTNLSFRFYPFDYKDKDDRSHYAEKGLMTTVTYEGAAAFYLAAREVINGQLAAKEFFLTVPCYGGASLMLERKAGQNNQMDTFIVISKNNEIIPFKFATMEVQQKEDGKTVTKIIEIGLGVFYKTLDGYLSSINADAHLNKLGDDLEKYQEEQLLSNLQSPINSHANGGYTYTPSRY